MNVQNAVVWFVYGVQFHVNSQNYNFTWIITWTSTYKNHFFDFKPIEWVSIFWLINWFWCCPKINSKLKFESKISIIIIVFTQSLTGVVEFGERVNIHWLVHDECCMSCSSHWYLQFPHALSLNFLIWNCFTWEHNGNKFNRRLHPMA